MKKYRFLWCMVLLSVFAFIFVGCTDEKSQTEIAELKSQVQQLQQQLDNLQYRVQNPTSTPTNTPTPTATPTNSPIPTATNTPTPTPTPTKSPVAIEITLDNWEEYFMINREVKWVYDAFDTFKELQIDHTFIVKDEYVSCFSSDSKLSVELTYYYGNYPVEFDEAAKTYTVHEEVDEETAKKMLTTKAISFPVDPSNYLIPSANAITRRSFLNSYTGTSTFTENPRVYQWPGRVTVSRIKGTLYLYE